MKTNPQPSPDLSVSHGNKTHHYEDKCEDCEEAMLENPHVKRLLAKAEKQVSEKIIRMLEVKGIDTPSGKLTPQQIDFTIRAIKNL